MRPVDRGPQRLLPGSASRPPLKRSSRCPIRSRSCSGEKTTVRAAANSSANGRLSSRWRCEAWRPRARLSSRPSSFSSGSDNGSISSRAAATPTQAADSCGPRSTGRRELLDDREQRVFRAACFRRRSFEAAEYVAAPTRHAPSLLDKSLLRRRDSNVGARSGCSTIREYGAERLGEADVARRPSTARRTRRAVGIEADPHLRHGSGWIERVALDYDNVRAAMRFALAAARFCVADRREYRVLRRAPRRLRGDAPGSSNRLTGSGERNSFGRKRSIVRRVCPPR